MPKVSKSRYRVGIKALKVTEKTGKVAAGRLVSQTQHMTLISKDGMVISMPLKDGSGIPNLGRNT